MSRTRKGKKRGPGYEYWGRRPGPRTPGRITKKITHRKERMIKNKIIQEEKKSLS